MGKLEILKRVTLNVKNNVNFLINRDNNERVSELEACIAIRSGIVEIDDLLELGINAVLRKPIRRKEDAKRIYNLLREIEEVLEIAEIEINKGEQAGDNGEPTKLEIYNVKKEIDKIIYSEGIHNYPGYEGAGRNVLIINNLVVKFPTEYEKTCISGYTQNMKELEVYYKTKHPLLVPIYATHKGCLICKLLISNEDCLEMGLTLSSEELQKSASILDDLVEEFNLNKEDILQPRNWGYDLDDMKFKCLDYGYTNKEV